MLQNNDHHRLIQSPASYRNAPQNINEGKKAETVPLKTGSPWHVSEAIVQFEFSPVKVSTAADGHEAVGVCQLAEYPDLVVVLETRPYHGHGEF